MYGVLFAAGARPCRSNSLAQTLNVIAVTLLAELHGRMGYFPAMLRLRPVTGSTPPRFEVAEIINLQTVRDRARSRR
jgi:hypothetical protein